MSDSVEHPTELRVLILKKYQSEFEELVESLQSVLDEHYYASVEALADPLRLTPVCNNHLPHFIVLDSRFDEMVETIEERENVPENFDSIPTLLLQHPDSELDFGPRFPMMISERLEPGTDRRVIFDHVESLIAQIGLEIKNGKVSERLVQRSIDVEIIPDELDCSLRGETTGMNRNGLGARVNLDDPDREPPESLANSPCTVRFHEQDLGFIPAEGNILRVEESWDEDYEAFVAVQFNPHVGFSNDPNTLEILESLIENQEDRSIRKSL